MEARMGRRENRKEVEREWVGKRGMGKIEGMKGNEGK